MKKNRSVVLSLRVPVELAEKVDKVADRIPRGSRSKVLAKFFLPAFDRYLKKEEKVAA